MQGLPIKVDPSGPGWCSMSTRHLELTAYGRHLWDLGALALWAYEAAAVTITLGVMFAGRATGSRGGQVGGGSAGIAADTLLAGARR
jgi:hypothetical protein